MDGLRKAESLLKRHMNTEAEGILRHVLEFAPLEGRAWHLLGRALQQHGRHGEALDCFAEAERCYARSKGKPPPPASLRLAKLLWSQGEGRAALAMLGALRQKKPQELQLQELYETWRQHLEAER
jgi:hypothetical protein